MSYVLQPFVYSTIRLLISSCFFFAFWKRCFDQTASNILLLLLNRCETVFLTRLCFLDVALDFFQSLVFFRETRCRKLSFACMLYCPDFCLFLYLTDVHFRGELRHVCAVSEQKLKYWPIRAQKISGARL